MSREIFGVDGGDHLERQRVNDGNRIRAFIRHINTWRQRRRDTRDMFFDFRKWGAT